jgi:NDP-sugar pyrophosphorylase family protein
MSRTKNNKKIDVFILAAGEANRMYPLNQIMEKSLLPVDGKPVIRHIVDNLQKCRRVGKITICCLTKFKKQFEHEFRDIPSIRFYDFEKPIGTYSSWFAAIEDEHIPEWSMVHYADCLTKIDYAHFISKIDKRFDGLIAATGMVKHDYSEIIFDVEDDDKKVKYFREKPLIHNYTWSGIGIFNENIMKYGTKLGIDFAFDIFPQMINEKKLVAYPYNGEWFDVGNLNSYRKVCELYNCR